MPSEPSGLEIKGSQISKSNPVVRSYHGRVSQSYSQDSILVVLTILNRPNGKTYPRGYTLLKHYGFLQQAM